jgi:hypothetical protein
MNWVLANATTAETKLVEVMKDHHARSKWADGPSIPLRVSLLPHRDTSAGQNSCFDTGQRGLVKQQVAKQVPKIIIQLCNIFLGNSSLPA